LLLRANSPFALTTPFSGPVQSYFVPFAGQKFRQLFLTNLISGSCRSPQSGQACRKALAKHRRAESDGAFLTNSAEKP
ncbi:MAG: hypothetical protein IJ551_11595, partial [Prevotella sp.]|nr:hypothetical protein [Prevotella sp.]